jgi:protein-S-isoprenylcysteine O-methyltransferase Ste14
MRALVRHLLSIAALPFMVAVVIPTWVARRDGVSVGVGQGASVLLVQALGVGLAIVGILLFASSLRRFATEGDGTLAPWDPPRRLVVRGPYRYVRNPMISGVLFVLAGEASILRSGPHAEWTIAFFVINLIYIPLLEEPQLKNRFGEQYSAYGARVPRLIPRWPPLPEAFEREIEVRRGE